MENFLLLIYLYIRFIIGGEEVLFMNPKGLKYRSRGSGPRDKQFIIRVTQTEREQLQKLASAAGVSVACFLLGLALGDGIGAALEGGDFDSKKG